MARSTVALVAIMIIGSVAGCDGSPRPEPLPAPTTQPIFQSGPGPYLIPGHTVTIGVKPDQPQISLQDGARFDGFEIRLADYIANATTGMPPVFSPVLTNTRDSALRDKKVPLVIATYSDTPERQEKVALAGPYMSTPQGILVRRSDERIRNVADLKGKVVCTVSESTSLRTLKELPYSITFDVKESYGACVERLRNKDVDVVSTDLLILYGYSGTSKDLDIASGENGDPVEIPSTANDAWMIGLQPGGEKDCNKVVDVLMKFLEDGSWESNFSIWFRDAQRQHKNWTQKFKPDPGSVKCAGKLKE